MTRRQFASLAAAAPLAVPTAHAEPVTGMGVGTASLHKRSGFERRMNKHPPITETLTFIDYCKSLGAGGVQAGLSETTGDYAKKVARATQDAGMYFEASGRLPADDTELDDFKDFVKAARNAGARAIRTVLFSGRRYENHTSLETFRQAQDRAWKMVTMAEPTLRKFGIKAGIENHKNLRIPEMLRLLDKLQSEYFGVTVDFGNNYVLMEDPIEIAEAFAPYAVTSHIKDHALKEYENGFLLLDAPLGEGIIDLPRMIQILRGAQPNIKFTLETMTRDALEVPWLTDKYWATFEPGDLPGEDLARTIRTVKAKQTDEPFPEVSALTPDEQIALEHQNVVKGIDYARNVLAI